jgi:AcrR family transcriptional regulator
MSDARRRVLQAAISCFAEKGYSATKISDIERAAGLSVGAGGTYRHFPTKRAILDAVIDATVGASDDELAPPSSDLEGAADASMTYMSADLVRMFFRDLDEFPEHRERIADRLVTGPYRIVAERIRSVNPGIDAEAVAAVLLGSLINFRTIEVLIGEGRNGVDRGRFVDAWADLYRLRLMPELNDRTTRPQAPRGPSPSKRTRRAEPAQAMSPGRKRADRSTQMG